jgi:F0F1-type ATP synthase assembly protein I
MENKETNKSGFLNTVSNEIKKKGFLKALTVFICCVIIGLVIGFLFDILQLAATLGIGLGLIWMGVAYFNQEE